MRKFIVALLLSVSLAGCADSSAATTAAETTTEAPTEETLDELSPDAFDMVSISRSTCLDRAGYNRRDHILYIRFLDSQAEYVYYDVPEEVYESLIDAESIGKYYNSDIKGQYECEKLE